MKINEVDGKEFLPKEIARLRIGRERKPLGPPAKPGNCAAYDVFTAILEERPYPVKAPVELRLQHRSCPTPIRGAAVTR